MSWPIFSIIIALLLLLLAGPGRLQDAWWFHIHAWQGWGLYIMLLLVMLGVLAVLIALLASPV